MKYDLMVVGAGILGAFHAYAAAKRGYKVLLVEKDSQPVQATVRNFGQVIPSGMTADLLPTALNSLDIYQTLQDQFDISARRNGSCYMASDEQELAMLQELHQQHQQTGYPSSLLSRDEVIRANPAVRKSYVKGALFFPEEFSVNPLQLVYRIIEFIQQEYGVEYRPNTRIIAMETGQDEVISRDSAGDQYRAAKAMVCNGHDFKTLFPSRFLNSDIELVKLQMMRTKPLQSVSLKGNLLSGRSIRRYESFRNLPSWRAGEADSELDKYGVHILFKQELDGSIIIGDSHEYADAREAEKLSFTLNQSLNERMLTEARNIVELPCWDIAQYWAGYYCQSKTDHYYQDDIDDKIHFLTAIGGKGMTLAPGIAEKNIAGIF
ncbi:TIGR03364 family FAD-dependent oxidoreductase [Endozoicomonas sp. 4G]|uniref:TIGR03364 family FAD-dependent oxidoreductase n=1 Tax=Endozoicomonas sp. 4G TaxID=2872754 RepID=UPI0020790736|nr:TIGR03364 family FAD-dependent oxidoreductase [Endozoicomonas sp. 4G]